MVSKIVAILVAVVLLVLNILIVTGESTNAGRITVDESGKVGQSRNLASCQQYAQNCDNERLKCCDKLRCLFKGSGDGTCVLTVFYP